MKRIILSAFFIIALCVAPLSSSNSHHLTAEGSPGWIRFWGNGTVTLSGKGTLIVKNMSNMRFEVKGEHVESNKIADGFEYRHFEGSVSAVGMGMHMELRGWNLKIDVEGSGKAHFSGKGTYSLDGKAPVKWAEKYGDWTKIRFRK